MLPADVSPANVLSLSALPIWADRAGEDSAVGKMGLDLCLAPDGGKQMTLTFDRRNGRGYP